jgi:hypothetical protein
MGSTFLRQNQKNIKKEMTTEKVTSRSGLKGMQCLENAEVKG